MMMLALMPAFSALAQYRDIDGYQELEDSENVASMKSHVRYLSSAMLEGRKAGSEGEKLAAEYVTEVLDSYGIDVLSPRDGELFGINFKTSAVRFSVKSPERFKTVIVINAFDICLHLFFEHDRIRKKTASYGSCGTFSV